MAKRKASATVGIGVFGVCNTVVTGAGDDGSRTPVIPGGIEGSACASISVAILLRALTKQSELPEYARSAVIKIMEAIIP